MMFYKMPVTLRAYMSGITQGIFEVMERLHESLPWESSTLTIDTPVLDDMLLNLYGARIISPAAERMGGTVPVPASAIPAIADYIYMMCKEKWKRIAAAIAAEYNPINNYDMTETEQGTDTHSGTDTQTDSGTDTATVQHGQTLSGTEQTQIFGFDSSTGTDSETRTTSSTSGGSDTSTVQHGKTTETEHGLQIGRNRTLTRSGNIGVTTSAQMVQGEIDVRQYNFWEQVVRDAADILTVPCYFY